VEFIGVELATPVEKATAGCTGGEDRPLAREGCKVEWGAREMERGTACDLAWRGTREPRGMGSMGARGGGHGDFCDLGSGFRANGRLIPNISV